MIKILKFYLTNGMMSFLYILKWMSILMAIFGIIVNIGGLVILNIISGNDPLFEIDYNIDVLIVLVVLGTIFMYAILAFFTGIAKIEFINKYCKKYKITKEAFYEKNLEEMLKLWWADWQKDD